MTRIKVCGIARAEDAAMASEAGADALGFIFVAGTPRCVAERRPEELLRWALPCALRVGVARRAEDVPPAWRGSLDAVQVYEPVPEGAWAPPRVFRAIRVKGRESLAECLSEPGRRDAFVLDAYSEAGLGGSGVTFDWDLAVEAVRVVGAPVMLAGGLTPANVEEAVRRVRPYGVDVSSGVEEGKGVKSAAAVRDFVAAVRRADGLCASGAG